MYCRMEITQKQEAEMVQFSEVGSPLAEKSPASLLVSLSGAQFDASKSASAGSASVPQGTANDR